MLTAPEQSAIDIVFLPNSWAWLLKLNNVQKATSDTIFFILTRIEINVTS
jgi:hypothetical protein